MKMRSHILLAGYLMNYIPACNLVKHRKIFILGCIEPDFNMLSYLKGSIKCQKLRGHNYNSSNSYILHLLKTLQSKKNWTLRDYYRLGKLMHYLADAFTYPHNVVFIGTLWEHRVYESYLHLYFKSYLRQYSRVNEKDYPKDAREFITELHRRYIRSSGDFNNDAEFIIQVTSQVMQSLAHGLAPVHYREGNAHYENTDYNGLVCTNH